MEPRGSSEQPPAAANQNSQAIQASQANQNIQANNSVAVQVRKILVQLYNEALVKFIEKILKNHNALIAGGSILSCILGRSNRPLYRINDLDIYVGANDAYKLYKKLEASPLFEEIGYNTFVAPEYDASFFKKNHIVFRTSFQCKVESILLRLDIIVVDKDHGITKVVSNFDLKCCEVWYMHDKPSDKFQVYCSSQINMTYLLKKQTFLSNDYFKSYINGNTYIKNRLEKYNRRNFKIYFGDINNTQIDNTKLTSVLKIELTAYEDHVDKKKSMDPAANEMWLLKKFFQDMLITRPSMTYSITPIILLFFRDLDKKTNPFIIFDTAISFYSAIIGKKPLELKLEIWMMGYNLAKSLNDVIHDPSPPFYKTALEKYLAFYLGIPFDVHVNVDLDKTLENKQFDKTALLQSNVWDFIMFDDIPYPDVDQLENIILVILGAGLSPNVYIGLPTTYLTHLIDNQRDNWFYECDGEIIASTGDKPPRAKGPAYCAVPVDKEGLKGLILVSHLKIMLSRRQGTIFIIEQDDSFSHTISHKNKNSYTANWVSSNHCQAGSTYIKFKVFQTNNIVDEDHAQYQYNDHLHAVYGQPVSNASRNPVPPTSIPTRPVRPSRTSGTSRTTRATSPSASSVSSVSSASSTSSRSSTTTTATRRPINVIPRPSSAFVRPLTTSSTVSTTVPSTRPSSARPAATSTGVARSTQPSIVTNISQQRAAPRSASSASSSTTTTTRTQPRPQINNFINRPTPAPAPVPAPLPPRFR